jgi:hypothetical protein
MTFRHMFSCVALMMVTGLAACSSGGSSTVPDPDQGSGDGGGDGGGGDAGDVAYTQLLERQESLLEELNALPSGTVAVVPTTGTAGYEGVMTIPLGVQTLTGAIVLTVDFDAAPAQPVTGAADNFFFNPDVFGNPQGPATAATGSLAITGGTVEPDSSNSDIPTSVLAFDGTLTTSGGMEFAVSGDGPARFFGPEGNYIAGVGTLDVSANGGPDQLSISSLFLEAE